MDQTCRTLLEKQGRAHKWCTPMDPLIWPNKSRTSAQTYLRQLCEDVGCSPEDQPEEMNDREKWQDRAMDIRAGGTTWWWWCIVCKTDVLSLCSRYISLVWFGFMAHQTVGYLMPNPVFTYILNISLVNTFCRYTQLNDQTIQFLTIKI